MALDGHQLCCPRSARMRLLALLACLGAPGLVACTVDSRKLERATSSRSSAAGDGAGGDSGLNSSPDHQPPIDIPVCTYSERSTASDCDTLVSNPGFATSTEGWRQDDSTMQIAWASDDASQDPGSGSVVVVNTLYAKSAGLAAGGAMQCVPAKPGATYLMAGDVFIPPDQDVGINDGGPYPARAGLNIWFWQGKDCSQATPTLGSAVTDLVSDTGKWLHVEGSAVAPEGIQSMAIVAFTVKDYREFRFKALFDNVLLQAR